MALLFALGFPIDFVYFSLGSVPSGAGRGRGPWPLRTTTKQYIRYPIQPSPRQAAQFSHFPTILVALKLPSLNSTSVKGSKSKRTWLAACPAAPRCCRASPAPSFGLGLLGLTAAFLFGLVRFDKGRVLFSWGWFSKLGSLSGSPI